MNYGSFTDGILTLKLIFNQPYVKTTDTFKLYMTELNDINFKKTYQKLESGFIIEESRQRPGDMQGYIETDTLTVQTFTPLTFNLKPSMNLSKNAFMVLVLPQTLDFQGPSCTVTNMKGGFSQKMYCQRLNYNLTLLNPFDYNFVAKSAEMLSM